MKNKKVIKIIIDVLMLIIILLEFSKLYTGQLLHEVFGIILFILFITHIKNCVNFIEKNYKIDII